MVSVIFVLGHKILLKSFAAFIKNLEKECFLAKIVR